MPAVDLTSHPAKTTEFGRWQQLNGPLGLDAFGLNAIVCEPGEEFDISHDEGETGHQEVYVVVSGRAAFTVGDERIEAGPGTVVSAPDPAVTRGYEALEPNTRIVCVGAAPGAAHPLRRVDRRGRAGRALARHAGHSTSRGLVMHLRAARAPGV